MAWTRSVLVVANVTATSDELRNALVARAARERTSFALVVPATAFGGGRHVAEQMLLTAVERLRAAGLEVEGSVGHEDPIIAISEAWDPRRFDEILISTLPSGTSKWLQCDLPQRAAKITGAPVTQVASAPPKRVHGPSPVRTHVKQGVLTPLSVLGWGAGEH
ncbi:MAG: hypothetical protein ACXVUL_23675 [Solirubrobacteraceae bacterium]